MKDANGGFLLILVVGLTVILGLSIVGTLLPMYAVLSFNASNSTVGLLVSLSVLVSLLIMLPSGMLSDKFGRKPVITLSLIASLVGISTLFFAPTIELVFIAQIAMGFTWPIFTPSMLAFVADLTSPADSGKAVGLFLLSTSIGMFSGPLLAGLLLKFASIRDTFLFSLIIVFFSLILTLRIPPSGSTFEKKSSYSLGSFWKNMKKKSVITTSLASSSFFFLNSFVTAFYPIYALEEYNVDPAVVAIVFSLRNLATVLIRIFALTKMASRVGEKRLIVIALTISTSVALLPITQNFAQSALVMIFVGLSHGIIYVIGSVILVESTPPQERGTTNSIYLLFLNVNSALSPVLMGFAAETWGIHVLFPLVAIAPIIGLVFSKYIP